MLILMKRIFFLLLIFPSFIFAQKMAAPEFIQNDSPVNTTNNDIRIFTPTHQWEIGLHGGLIGTYGDVKFQPTWAAGAHLRKAIDYIFSLRIDGRIGQSKGEDLHNGAYITDFQTASAQLVVSINGMNWDDQRQKKFNPYLFAGGGLTRFRVDALPRNISQIEEQNWTSLTQFEGGLGIAYRINEKINIGIESNLVIPMGSKADLIDGIDREVKDVLNYTNIRLNFNIGNGEDISEPLYWVSPMASLRAQITELKDRPKFDPTDSDNDGVLDMMDEELNTPAGAIVDVRGRTLDSDGDGYPDYLDQDPYSVPGYSVDENGVTNDTTFNYTTETEVQKMIDNALKSQTEAEATNFDRDIELINWIMPLVHFDIDSYNIRNADFGNLVNVAKIMKGKPSIKIVVTGYTDKTASDIYNQVLSYDRAKAVIEFLVVAQGIPRDRLILKYSGENHELVPTNGDNFINRRVEFRVAKKGERDMEHPKK